MRSLINVYFSKKKFRVIIWERERREITNWKVNIRYGETVDKSNIKPLQHSENVSLYENRVPGHVQ